MVNKNALASHIINIEPSELSHLQLSEQIASESVANEYEYSK